MMKLNLVRIFLCLALAAGPSLGADERQSSPPRLFALDYEVTGGKLAASPRIQKFRCVPVTNLDCANLKAVAERVAGTPEGAEAGIADAPSYSLRWIAVGRVTREWKWQGTLSGAAPELRILVALAQAAT